MLLVRSSVTRIHIITGTYNSNTGTAPRDKHLRHGELIENPTNQPICFYKIRDHNNTLQFEKTLELNHGTGAVWNLQWEHSGDKRLAVCLGNYAVKILSLHVEMGELSPVKRNTTLSHEGLHFSIIRWSPSWSQHVLTGTLEGCVVLWFVPQDSDSQFSNVPLFVFGTFFFF